MSITSAELMILASSGKVAVEFRAEAENLEGYAEAGMRAHVVGVDLREDDLGVLHVDFSAFDAFNQGFESANYYDGKGNPCLTARQAGHYQPEDHLYVSASEDLSDILVVLDKPRLQLIAEFNASGSPSYVSWLEEQVLGKRD